MDHMQSEHGIKQTYFFKIIYTAVTIKENK